MPKVFHGSGCNAHKVVVSLCDYSGNWPKPWHEAGHTVLCYDLKHGDDVTILEVAKVYADLYEAVPPAAGVPVVDCILAAPPCTCFTVSGARWWPKHDASGETAAMLRVFDACVALIKALRPRVWAIENPVGRLPRLRLDFGRPAFYFNPHEYAGLADDPAKEAYTKRTGIWTNGVNPADVVGMPRYWVAPVMIEKGGKRGSWMWANLGGKSERTKELRSMTPTGFARAFYAANRP